MDAWRCVARRRSLPARPVLGESQQLPRTFEQRFTLDDRPQLRRGRVVVPEVRDGPQPVEDHRVASSVQTGGGERREIPFDDIGERGTPPQGERVVEESDGPLGLVPLGGRTTRGDQVVEGRRVHRDGVA